jgi:XRE family transcriptional regulator, thiamine biosynthesis regulator
VQPPDELMVQSFLPAMRQLVSARLRSRGLSQSRIASVLGITQASVSLYLSTRPEKAYDALSRFQVSPSAAESYAESLAEDAVRSTAEGVRTVTRIWAGLLGEGRACRAHREQYPALAECDVCLKEYGGQNHPRLEAVSDVADAVRVLEASDSFVSVMPEVSVNLACAPVGATSPAEVVAIPGRIVRARGRARATLPPEAGASMHLSKVLLMVRLVRPEVRACLNLKYDRRMARALRALRLKPLTLGGRSLRGGEDPTAVALETRLGTPVEPFDVVVDPGTEGTEPNVYLFSTGARQVAELALAVSEAYSGS